MPLYVQELRNVDGNYYGINQGSKIINIGNRKVWFLRLVAGQKNYGQTRVSQYIETVTLIQKVNMPNL